MKPYFNIFVTVIIFLVSHNLSAQPGLNIQNRINSKVQTRAHGKVVNKATAKAANTATAKASQKAADEAAKKSAATAAQKAALEIKTTDRTKKPTPSTNKGKKNG